jgi:hypothetical protein
LRLNSQSARSGSRRANPPSDTLPGPLFFDDARQQRIVLGNPGYDSWALSLSDFSWSSLGHSGPSPGANGVLDPDRDRVVITEREVNRVEVLSLESSSGRQELLRRFSDRAQSSTRRGTAFSVSPARTTSVPAFRFDLNTPYCDE